jgi:hypothetical protein
MAGQYRGDRTSTDRQYGGQNAGYGRGDAIPDNEGRNFDRYGRQPGEWPDDPGYSGYTPRRGRRDDEGHYLPRGSRRSGEGPGGVSAETAERAGRTSDAVPETDYGYEYFRGDHRPGRGAHHGLGPKDYVRSDERILDDVCSSLSDAGDVDASDITVRCQGGVVTLEGKIDSLQAKHRAEIIADRCSGVKEVENHLRVTRGGRNDQSTDQAVGKGTSLQGGTDYSNLANAGRDRDDKGPRH